MTRPAACVLCRQNKLGCNANITFPSPCSRCASRNVECKIDVHYRRVPIKNRLIELTKELDRIKRSGGGQVTSENSQDSMPWTSSIPLPAENPEFLDETVTSPLAHDVSVPSPKSSLVSDFSPTLDDMVLQLYFLYYHEHLPLLDPGIGSAFIFNASPLLFWTIMFTASRNIPSKRSLFDALSKSLPTLFSQIMIHKDSSLYTIQALLILTELRCKWQCKLDFIASVSSMSITLSDFKEPKSRKLYILAPGGAVVYQRYVSLSCELGLPCLVPFDALEIKAVDEAALPSAFISKLRIILFISRINDVLGESNPSDGIRQMRLVRLFEKELSTIAAEIRRSATQWNSDVEFVYLGVLLNLYSFCLRSSSTATGEPEHSIIQSSAAHSASQLVRIYATSKFPANKTPPSGVHTQLYYPYYCFRFTNQAMYALLKISALNKLSDKELENVNESIRLGHGTFRACSKSENDDNGRASRVIETLCKKGVIDQSPGNPVQSRLGASLSYELIVTAVKWYKQRDKDARQGATVSELRDTTITNPEDVSDFAQADLSGIDMNNFFFDNDSWPDCLDFTQPDLGLGSSFDWWGA